MTNYEIIDAVCDSINPLLFFATLGCVVFQLVKGENRKAAIPSAFLSFGLLLVYGISAVDHKWDIWPSFGADYSTHAAFAIAACAALSLCIGYRIALLGLLAMYMLLMLYQQYHSIVHIVTTSAVVGLALWPGMRLANRLLGSTDNGLKSALD